LAAEKVEALPVQLQLSDKHLGYDLGSAKHAQ